MLEQNDREDMYLWVKQFHESLFILPSDFSGCIIDGNIFPLLPNFNRKVKDPIGFSSSYMQM